jgi:hypothetical protein
MCEPITSRKRCISQGVELTWLYQFFGAVSNEPQAYGGHEKCCIWFGSLNEDAKNAGLHSLLKCCFTEANIYPISNSISSMHFSLMVYIRLLMLLHVHALVQLEQGKGIGHTGAPTTCSQCFSKWEWLHLREKIITDSQPLGMPQHVP